MIQTLVIVAGVVAALLLVGGLLWIVGKMPPSKNRLEPHSHGGDWWQSDGSDGGGHGGGL